MLDYVEPERDVEGYLIDPEDWDELVACALADEEEVVLEEDYWPVLKFMRDYWREYKVAPDVRHVVDYMAREQDADKQSAKQHLFRMFPYGYVQQACKIAGMQKPRAWSTG
ncbi:MAG: TusE/DsrC/DsvC family sulfur relay protein [Gammaproteobacteria bacterium]|nr:TusE/DsrC/DsvC family sulfur relay protein [Gammaproteobacteria bacterium]